MLRFFKIIENELEINKEELYLIPSAKALVVDDKGGVIHGDYDGRKKLMAKKKLGLAWWVVDINSPGVQAGLEGDELMEDGIKSLAIPNDWEWKKDAKFKAFLEDYMEMYNKASYIRLLKNILIAFNDSAAIIKAIQDQARKTLKDKIDLDPEDMKLLITAQNQIIDIAGNVPKHIEKLKNLQNIVAREEKEKSLARGDRLVTSSMQPNS